ncbi:acyltransferase domain-containing protein [Lentzea sp. E54]|uniref:acyltransferase domain-containing protein n=1 Tax=Lentzea xerophila TaxID=3435883 RepID=UPI003DA32793
MAVLGVGTRRSEIAEAVSAALDIASAEPSALEGARVFAAISTSVGSSDASFAAGVRLVEALAKQHGWDGGTFLSGRSGLATAQDAIHALAAGVVDVAVVIGVEMTGAGADVVLLKRWADARRDEDRVLAVVTSAAPAQVDRRESTDLAGFTAIVLQLSRAGAGWPRHAGRATAVVSSPGEPDVQIILEEPEEPYTGGPRLAVLSAPSQNDLLHRAAQLADWLRSPAGKQADVADVAHSLVRQDEGAEHRMAVLASDVAELATGLTSNEITGFTARPADPVFVFSGHGSEWHGMGRDLLASEPVFAHAVDALGGLFSEHFGRTLRDLINTSREWSLEEVEAAIFGLQLALVAQWKALGVRPAAVIGHSLGSVAAAVVSGGLTVEQGVAVVAARSHLISELPMGALAVVEMTREEVEDCLGVEFAVDLAPGRVTVSGSADRLDDLVTELQGRGRGAQRVLADFAAHSSAVEPAAARLPAVLQGLRGSAPIVRWYDTVWTDPAEQPTFCPEYWAAHMRRPVLLCTAVESAAADGHRVFLEIAPHSVLRSSVALTLRKAGVHDHVVVGSLCRERDEIRAMRAALATLYCAGVQVAPGDRHGQLVDLPPASWRYAPVRSEANTVATTTDVVHTIAAVMDLPIEAVRRDVALIDLGLDSLMAWQISTALHRDFGLEVESAELLRGASLSDLVGGTRTATRSPARPQALDETDRLIMRLWSEHTGAEAADLSARVSGQDGQVRLAERLAASLNSAFGGALDGAEILEHDSLSALANLVREKSHQQNEDNPVRVLTEGGEDPAPLLLFHPGGGTCAAYHSLVDILPASLRVLGFERVPGTSLDERVSRLLPLVRTAQPHGPYRLAGWSFGGATAYAVATALMAGGEEVELVALLDTMIPLSHEGDPLVSTARRFLRFSRHIEQTYGTSVELSLDELASLTEEAQIELTVRRLADTGVMPAGSLRHQEQFFRDSLAKELTPPGPYDGRVVLYRALEPFGPAQELEPRYARSDLGAGWDVLCPRLEVVPVAGAHHLSVVDPPHIAPVARHLSWLLGHHPA